MKHLSIRTKFILAFIAVIMIAIALVSVFIGLTSNQRFEMLLVDEEIDTLTQTILDHYQTNDTLIGIEAVLRPPPGILPPEVNDLPRIGFILADLDGRVILGDENKPRGTKLAPEELFNATALEMDNETIGYLLIRNPVPELTPRQKNFLDQINAALLYASLGGIILAVILGLVLTKSLLKPLENLNMAIKKMGEGELSQDVVVKSDDELGQVIQTFNQMSKTIAKATQRREQMTADIAHELRSPLTVISGYLEALQEGALAPTPERIETIKAEVDQLNRLVNDLRTLALADAGQLSIIISEIDLRALFTRLENAFNLIARSKQVQLKFSCDPNIQNVYADEGRIIQALSKLIKNALRHTPAGGKITTTAEASQSNQIVFKVKDTGQGIAPEKQHHLFERFYRVESSRQTTEGETGLGLSIVKAIIEAHHGQVQVQSELGKGATFILTMPNQPPQI